MNNKQIDLNQIINISEEQAFPSAQEKFIQTCVFDLENNAKHRRMMKVGAKVREDGLEGIKIRAVARFFDKEVFDKGTIKIEDMEITCNYFSQLPEDAVVGAYFYMLTAGECFFSSEENIMDFLFADIWGTNYVDAGIEILNEDYIKADLKSRFKDKRVWLSEEFGPGYFGMPTEETKKFFKILNGDLIGVKVKESGLMIPQKSCTGLYLVYDREDIHAEPSCLKCVGNPKGCQFCQIRAKKEK